MIVRPTNSFFLSREGATFVELLLVVFIVAILVFFCGPEFLAASCNEKNLRNEAFVRSKLIIHLASLERYLSLGNNVVVSNGAYCVEFPLETGGVSLETNRAVRVFGVEAECASNSDVVTTVLRRKDEDLKPVDESRHGKGMDATPILLNRSLETRITDLTVEGSGPVRLVKLTAEFPWMTGYGTASNRSVTVSRMVRIWNYIE